MGAKEDVGRIVAKPKPKFREFGPPGVPVRPQPYAYLEVAGACRWARVDLRDYGRAREITWHTDAYGYPVGRWRRELGGDGYEVKLHVFILGRRAGYVIDHVDGDKRNCRRRNLRHVRPRTNARNRPASRNSRSGVRGVHALRGLWRVEFEYCRRHVRLGATADLELAQATSAVAIPLIFGRDARLADGTAFDEDKIDSLAEIARGLPPEVLRRVLDRTARLGDALSAQLRERILKDGSLRISGDGGSAKTRPAGAALGLCPKPRSLSL